MCGGNQRKVISEGNIRYKFSRLYELAFGS